MCCVFQRIGTLLSKDVTSLRLWHLYVFAKMPKMPKDEPDIFLMWRSSVFSELEALGEKSGIAPGRLFSSHHNTIGTTDWAKFAAHEWRMGPFMLSTH